MISWIPKTIRRRITYFACRLGTSYPFWIPPRHREHTSWHACMALPSCLSRLSNKSDILLNLHHQSCSYLFHKLLSFQTACHLQWSSALEIRVPTHAEEWRQAVSNKWSHILKWDYLLSFWLPKDNKFVRLLWNPSLCLENLVRLLWLLVGKLKTFRLDTCTHWLECVRNCSPSKVWNLRMPYHLL